MDDYIRQRHQLENMPGYRLILESFGFQNSVHIFDGNYNELVKTISAVTENELFMKIVQPENKEGLHVINQELIRLLHNFVASAMSLIDHTRNSYKHFLKLDGKFPDYQKRVDANFKSNPLSQFVKCLRQYCQHYKSPELHYTTNVINDIAYHAVCLRSDDLLSFDGWSSQAKLYIHANSADIDISRVANEYRENVIEFCNWYQQRQREINISDIQDYFKQESILIAAQLEIHIDIFINNFKQHPGPPDYYLSYVLGDQYKTILDIPHNDTNRINKVIDLLGSRITLSDSLKEKIREAYVLSALSNSDKD